MKIIAFRFLSVLLFITTSCASVSPLKPNLAEQDKTQKPVLIAPREQVEARGKKWVIVTQGKYSTQAAANVLRQGGSVIDALIAATFTISVERPHSTGIGGGGFLIFHEAKTGKNYVLDFRERAPARATAKMFLDANGKVIPDLSKVGALASGVPGIVAGMVRLHQRWGTKKWPELVEPAVKLATEGFPIYPHLADSILEEKEKLKKFPSSAKIFLKEDGQPRLEGEILVQEDLAKSLREISVAPDAFYVGDISKKIVKSQQALGGLINAEDLKSYTVKEHEPVEIDWNGYHLVSMPPPSAGGIHVLQILKLLENDPLPSYGFLSAQSWHLQASAMQQAFADRAKYLGDPAFVSVPVKGLLDSEYLAGLRKKFSIRKAKTSKQVFPGKPPADGSSHTSNISIMDAEGNVVVSTQSINSHFASQVVAEGTGIVMNNTMDDFSAKQKEMNHYGAISLSDANAVAPGKTPLSSMAPTIVLKDGKAVMGVGSMGGTRIITAVAQTIQNYLLFKKDLYESVAAPRIHQQWFPGFLKIENQDVATPTLNELHKKGWVIERTKAVTDLNAVSRDGSDLIGVADPRDIGTSAAE